MRGEPEKHDHTSTLEERFHVLLSWAAQTHLWQPFPCHKFRWLCQQIIWIIVLKSWKERIRNYCFLQELLFLPSFGSSWNTFETLFSFFNRDLTGTDVVLLTTHHQNFHYNVTEWFVFLPLCRCSFNWPLRPYSKWTSQSSCCQHSRPWEQPDNFLFVK